MTRRALYDRTVTDVVLKNEGGPEMLNNLAGIVGAGIEMKQKDDLAKMNNYAADAQLQMAKLTQDWRVANESDPFNKDAADSLHTQYKAILSSYDQSIGLMSKKDWSIVSQKMIKQSQAENFDWATKTAVKNTERNVNDSIKKNTQIAYQLGQTSDFNKAEISFQNAEAGIRAFSDGVIGAETQKKLLDDFRSDYMKSFLVGMAETDPDKAIEVLKQKGIAEKVGDVDNIKLINNYALKKKKEQEYIRKQVRQRSIHAEQLNILRGGSSFDQIDSKIGVDYDEADAAKLRQQLVTLNAANDNEQKVNRYLNKLSELNIESADDAEKIYNMVLDDDSLSLNDKEDILMTGVFGTKQDISLADVAGGGITDMGEVKQGRNEAIYGKGFVGWIKQVWGGITNDMKGKDAVDTYKEFLKMADAKDRPNDISVKLKKAKAIVAKQRNPFLDSIGNDWETLQDPNTGELFDVRMNEDGLFDVRPAMMDEEEDWSQDNGSDGSASSKQ